MKMRNGFVSNSSSSSYMIGIDVDLSIENVLQKLEIPEKHPMRKIAEILAEMCMYAKKVDMSTYKGELPPILKEITDKKLTPYEFEVSSEGEDGMELLLYNTELIIRKNDFILGGKW